MACQTVQTLQIRDLEKALSHFMKTCDQLNEKCDALLKERDELRIDGLSECYETLELERDQLDAVCRERARLLEDAQAR